MNKNIFDEAMKDIDEIKSYRVMGYNYYPIPTSDIIKALELGKLYEEFYEFYHMRFSTTSGADDLREADKKIKKFYKEL